MEKLVNRKTPLMSKNKIVHAIELYEQYVDEPIESFKIWGSTFYEIKSSCNNYSVNIATNKVNKSYPDI
jgi:hypothetical protein